MLELIPFLRTIGYTVVERPYAILFETKLVTITVRFSGEVEISFPSIGKAMPLGIISAEELHELLMLFGEVSGEGLEEISKAVAATFGYVEE